MKKKILILALVMTLSLMAVGLALANGTAAIDWWVLGGGGGPVGDGNGIALNATLGQPVIGPSSADRASLGAGYWYGDDSGPTAVSLASFQALPSGAGILVSWETSGEIDTLGFDLYRQVRGQGASGLSSREKLNKALIPSRSPGGVAGAVYTWFDPAVQGGMTYVYILEEVGVNGQRTHHGPVEATAPYAVLLPVVWR